MHRLPPVLLRLLCVLVAAVAVVALGPVSAGADSICTKVAAPGGSDSAAGTEDEPFATVDELVEDLGPGDIACLRAGTYQEQNVTINSGGSGEDSRAVLRSYPGERAKIAGRLYVTDNANYLTVEGLDLDGHDAPSCDSTDICRLPSPTVNGDHVTFQDNDVTNRHRGICFNLGNKGYGQAVDVVIQRNRIHDCGTLPANNHEHGIYLSWSDGVKILNNVIYDNADRGIQLYPDADRTFIKGNVIDGNGVGVIFSGAGSSTSDDNKLVNNIITNSKIRYDVESWFPDGVGTGNVVRDNCIHGGHNGEISDGLGFNTLTNRKADPLYVDRAGKDYRLREGSPCTEVLDGAVLPAQPGVRPGKTTGTPPPPRGDDEGEAAHVTISNAMLRRARGPQRRWKLRVSGHVYGADAGDRYRAILWARRGGSWQRIAARNVGELYRIRTDARIPRLHSARVTRVRVEVRGVGTSRPAYAYVRRAGR